LALAEDRADLYALTRLQGEILHDLGSIQESIAAFERAIEVAEDPIERCRALLGLAAGMRVTDRFEEAFALLDDADSIASTQGLTAELARIHHLRGNLYFPLGRLQECLREHEFALDLARKADVPELEARALGGLGDAEYARGRMASAHRYFSRCVELSKTHGSGRVEVANLAMVAYTEVFLNDISGALSTATAAIALAARIGHPRAEIVAHNAAISAYRMTGELGLAKKHTERVLTLLRGLGARRFEAMNLNDQAEILNAEGCRSEALNAIRRGIEISRETGLGFVGPWLLAHLAITTEDPVERRQALSEGEDILGKGALSHNHLWFYRYAIESSLNEGAWDAAERYAEALENYTQAEAVPWADYCIKWGRGLAKHGRTPHDDGLVCELLRIGEEAQRLNIRTALPLVERAIGSQLPTLVSS
jgi:tetratricopeptide (TPR) repeat protein